jgi:hypothetical protein
VNEGNLGGGSCPGQVPCVSIQSAIEEDVEAEYEQRKRCCNRKKDDEEQPPPDADPVRRHPIL